jgi:hypothetical protein
MSFNSALNGGGDQLDALLPGYTLNNRRTVVLHMEIIGKMLVFCGPVHSQLLHWPAYLNYLTQIYYRYHHHHPWFDHPNNNLWSVQIKNEVLHNLYASLNIISMIKPMRVRWAGHAARMREMRNAYNISVRKPQKKRPVGRRGCGWEDNIKMVKGKSCPCLFLTEHCAMKAYRGNGGIAPPILWPRH